MIIADTGFWLALANCRDKYHDAATHCLFKLSAQKETFVTTWPVMAETCHLLLREMGNVAQIKFIENYRRGAFDVFAIDCKHAGRIEILMQKYAQLPMDLADASLVILAEHLEIGYILSTDRRDFLTYRWKQNKPFQNLLIP